MPWGSPEEIERRRRIRLCVWAYAYEVMNDQMVGDDIWERECLAADINVVTNNESYDTSCRLRNKPVHDFDYWFSENFDPSTGSWVHSHPDLDGLHDLYMRMTGL